MTFPERRVEWPLDPPEARGENVQDVVPPTERNQDPEVTETTRGMTLDGSRPLTDAERKAADHDAAVGERVYAPASERVPREPVAGHRDFVEHPDTHTPERQAAVQPNPTGEPSFTRVRRPTGTGANSEAWSDAETSAAQSRTRTPMAVGWAIGLGMCGGVGLWLWLRWQRERNRPINRIRRQARQTAYELRERMPSGDEAARPAVGLSTALLSVLALLWQQSRSRNASSVAPRDARSRADRIMRRTDKAARQAAQKISEADWQDRLARLKARWDPRRLELEKRSITRH